MPKPLKPQSQAALADQLLELVQVANQNGLYDAADWLQARLWAETAIGLHPTNERLQRSVKHVAAIRTSDRVEFYIGHKGDGAQWVKRSHAETLDASLSEARTVTGFAFQISTLTYTTRQIRASKVDFPYPLLSGAV